jgi:Family of unknown function (DUF6318)
VSIRIALAACAVLAVATSCTGDASPSPLPSPSSPAASASPSPTPTPTATASPKPPSPTLPALARQDSTAGAEAFARFWLTALDYAYKTGDTDSLRSVGSCAGCIGQANGIDKIYDSGGRIEGGMVRVIETSTVRRVRGSAALVRVVYRQDRGRIIGADGNVTSQAARPKLSLLFTLARQGGSWTTTAIQPLKES